MVTRTSSPVTACHGSGPMRTQQQKRSRFAMRAIAACAALASSAVALTGCATAPVSGGLSSGVSRPSSSTLTAADLERVPSATTALEAVRQLRPLFLHPRPTPSTIRGAAPTIAVYINDMYSGGVDVLNTIPTNAVDTMRYLQPTEAMTFAGSQRRGDGYIMVRLKGFAHSGAQ